MSAPLVDELRVRARAKVLAREDRLMRDALVECRRSAGMTQADVAATLGVSKQAIQKLERYDADPKLSTLRRYANAVGAIVEHRVTADVGQSELLAARSAWDGLTARITFSFDPADAAGSPRVAPGTSWERAASAHGHVSLEPQYA